MLASVSLLNMQRLKHTQTHTHTQNAKHARQFYLSTSDSGDLATSYPEYSESGYCSEPD